MNAAPANSTRISRGKRLAFRVVFLAVLVAALYLFDWAAGRLYTRFAPDSGRRAVSALLADDDVAKAGFFVSHPYLFYAFRPGLRHFGIQQFNSRGHRGPEVADEPPEGVVRILCIGGSTTAAFPYVPRPNDAWPGRLEKLLEEETGTSVEVINAGLNGANSADLLAHYVFRNRHLGAHIAVMHLGGNDANALFFEEYDPEYIHYTRGWQTSSVEARPYERLWLRSNLLKWLYAVWLREIPLESRLGRDDITTVDPEIALQRVRETAPEGFERNVDLLLHLVRHDNTIPVIFPFVWAPEARFRKDRTFGRYYEAFALAFQKNREILQELAARHGAIWLPMADGAIDASMFKDWCHLNEEGEKIKARHVADGIKPLVIRIARHGRLLDHREDS